MSNEEKFDHVRPTVKASKGERGVALLIAIMVVAMITIFSTDLILNSQIALEQTVAGRDSIKAEYNAKSGLNIGVFLTLVDLALDKFLSGPMSPMPQKPNDALGDVWSVMNDLPIGGDTAEMMDGMKESFGLSAISDDKLMDQLKGIEGSISTRVEDESGKINLNYMAQGRGTEVVAMLEALFTCPAEREFLQNKKLNGTELAYRIKDWIDDNKESEANSGHTNEDDPYQRANPPYRAQNAPFDSLAGLRMVDGWDDELDAVFSPYLTVFPLQKAAQDKPKMNINTVPIELMNCFFPKAHVDCKDNYLEMLKGRNEDQAAVVSEAKEISGILRDNFCYKSDAAKKETWFTNTTNLFRIVVEGSVGNYSRTLTAVIERKAPNAGGSTTGSAAIPAAGATNTNKDETYELLYWQMN